MHFDSSKLPDPSNEYVCWIDIMGTKSIMTDSLEIASNFVFKFHAAINATKNKDATYYPLMDGVFITTPKQTVLKKVVGNTFKTLAEIFITEENNRHRFIVKGAISFGPVIHGKNVPPEACEAFAENLEYKRSLLMGTPMIQAFSIESQAPPFGIFLHESARTFAETGKKRFTGKYFQWYHKDFDKGKMLTQIESYFEWCKKYSYALQLEKSKIEKYLELSKEYFNNYN